MWTGSRTGHKRPYGQLRVGRGESNKMAHRLSYEMHKGPIPLDENGETLFIDHLCYDSEGYSNKLCVNPDHLEATTDLINKRRGYNMKRKAGWKHYKQIRKDGVKQMGTVVNSPVLYVDIGAAPALMNCAGAFKYPSEATGSPQTGERSV